MAARYLGIALGGSIALALLHVVRHARATLCVKERSAQLWEDTSGLGNRGGIAICTFGIVLCGEAGRRRDIELKADAAGGEDVQLRQRVLVAIVAGILERMFRVRTWIDGETDRQNLGRQRHRPALSRTMSVLIAVLTGGFISNALSCLVMNFQQRARSATTFASMANTSATCCLSGSPASRGSSSSSSTAWVKRSSAKQYRILQLVDPHGVHRRVPESVGPDFHEWHGTSQKTKSLVWIGILILIGSTVVIGVGNKLAVAEGATTPAAEEIEAP